MNTFNRITIVGNLGRDVELKYTPAGMAVGNFSVATTESRKSKDKDSESGYDKITTWFNCTVWGKQAENAAKFLVKGSPVYLDGKLTEERWTDKEGNEKTKLAINVTDVQFLERKDQAQSASASSGSEKATTTSKSKKAEVEDEDIPF